MTFPGVDWKTIGRIIKAQSKLGEIDWVEIGRIMKNQIRKNRKRRARKPPPPIVKIRVIHKYVYVPVANASPAASAGTEPVEGASKQVSTPKIAGPKKARKRAPKRSAPKDTSLWQNTPAPTTEGLPKKIPEGVEDLKEYIYRYLPEEALRLDRKSFNLYSDRHGVRSRLASPKDGVAKLALDTLTAARRRALAREYAERKRAQKRQDGPSN